MICLILSLFTVGIFDYQVVKTLIYIYTFSLEGRNSSPVLDMTDSALLWKTPRLTYPLFME